MQNYVLALSMMSLAFAGCVEDDPDGPFWSYEGDEGPDNWGQLDEEWAICAEGSSQSPIDLDSQLVAMDFDDFAFTNPGTGVALYNNGHTIQYDVDAGSMAVIDGVDYELLQFHFHARSEHTVDGDGYPMEVHLVHIDMDGNLAVLGAFIEEGGENATLAGARWDALPQGDLERLDDEATTFDPYELIPGGPVWKYSGSLTTPPCSEGVSWNVFTTPITMSSAQIAAYTGLYDNNYRPVQPLNGRDLNLGE